MRLKKKGKVADQHFFSAVVFSDVATFADVESKRSYSVFELMNYSRRTTPRWHSTRDRFPFAGIADQARPFLRPSIKIEKNPVITRYETIWRTFQSADGRCWTTNHFFSGRQRSRVPLRSDHGPSKKLAHTFHAITVIKKCRKRTHLSPDRL